MRKESHIWSVREGRVKSEMANCVNFARRMRLPALHFQLDDHIPTMASYQTSKISLGVQPPLSGDSEAIRKFSDKYIVPEKLVAEYVEHLAQIKMRKEKRKEENERERMERLNGEYNNTDWVGLYNSDKLSSLRVDELSLYFSHHKITFKGKKAEKVAMIKAFIGSLLYDSMESQQLRQPPLRNLQQQVTSSLSEVETDSQSDVVDQIVGSSPSSLSDKSSPETDFIPESRAETLPLSKYGGRRARSRETIMLVGRR